MLIQQRKKSNDPFNIFINQLLVGKNNLIGIQIGSYRGQSAQYFLKSNAFKTLYCIDPWLPGYDPKDLASSEDIYLAEQEFDERFKNNDIIKKIKAKSSNVVNMFEDNSIDFIYIDGCHTYEAVKEDLQNYYSKIKNGGIVAGHDWHWEGVQKGIIEYFNKNPLKVFPDDSWYFIKK